MYKHITKQIRRYTADVQRNTDISEGYTGSRHLFLAYHSFISVFFNLYLSLLQLFPVSPSPICTCLLLPISICPPPISCLSFTYICLLQPIPFSPPPISYLSFTYTCLLQPISISTPPISYLSFTYTCLLQPISISPLYLPVYPSLISVFFILYLSLLRLFPVYPSAKHVFINLYRSVLRLFPVSPSLLSVFFNLYLSLFRLFPVFPSPISVFFNLYLSRAFKVQSGENIIS